MSNIPPAIRLALGALVISLTVASCSRSAQSHFDRGNGYLAKGNEAAAILEFRNAVRKDARFARAREAGRALPEARQRCRGLRRVPCAPRICSRMTRTFS